MDNYIEIYLGGGVKFVLTFTFFKMTMKYEISQAYYLTNYDIFRTYNFLALASTYFFISIYFINW